MVQIVNVITTLTLSFHIMLQNTVLTRIDKSVTLYLKETHCINTAYTVSMNALKRDMIVHISCTNLARICINQLAYKFLFATVQSSRDSSAGSQLVASYKQT